MPFTDLLTRRAEAAEPTLRRMRSERRRASFQVQPLLAAIENNLFDSDFTVGRLLRQCRVRDREILRRFKQQLDRTPRAYIEHCRLEVAARLLATTGLGVGEIGDLVGYTRLATFSTAFRRWSGLSPLVYRKRCRDGADLKELLEVPVLKEGEPGDRRQALISKLACLEALAEGASLDPLELPLPVTIDGRKFERPLVDELWAVLESSPWQLQRRLIREDVRFASPELFHFLRRKSRELGRKDRQRGVEVAQLALWSLQSSADLLGPELPGPLVQAWSWLGNAYRLALNFGAAEQAFLRAEEESRNSAIPPLARADLLQTKAALRWAQTRYDEALDLVNGAVPIFRASADPSSLSQALLLRSNTARYARKSGQALADLQEAEPLVLELNDDYLTACLYTSWVSLHLLNLTLPLAEQTLHRAREAIKRVGQGRASALICWLEGRLLQAKEDPAAAARLRDARAMLEDQGEVLLAAVVRLDLALDYLQEGEPAKSTDELMKAMPVFESLSVDRNLFAAIRMLRDSVSRNEARWTDLARQVQRAALGGALQP